MLAGAVVFWPSASGDDAFVSATWKWLAAVPEGRVEL